MGYSKLRQLIAPLPKVRYMMGWRYYLVHPVRFVKDLTRNIKDRWYRARYGFAPIDAWNMDWYLCKVISRMCKYLADTSCGYTDQIFSSMEDYQDWLRLLSNVFEIALVDEFDDEELDNCFVAFKFLQINSDGLARCLFKDIVTIIEDDRLSLRVKQSRITELGFEQLSEYYYVLWD